MTSSNLLLIILALGVALIILSIDAYSIQQAIMAKGYQQ